MSDCFLAEVISFSSSTFKGKVKPLILEADGSTHSDINVEAKSVSGVTPSVGDLVLVVTSRNNLNDKPIHRYNQTSESNCRIIAVVKKNGQNFVFTGDYQFKGDVEITGNATFKQDLKVEGDTELEGKLDVGGDVVIDGDAEIGGGFKVGGNTQFKGGIWFETHTHTITAPGAQSGPPQAGPPPPP